MLKGLVDSWSRFGEIAKEDEETAAISLNMGWRFKG